MKTLAQHPTSSNQITIILYGDLTNIYDVKLTGPKNKDGAADTKLFADTLRAGATGLFDQIKITSLTARNDTTRDSIISALQRFTAIKPDDLFIL